LRDEGKNLMLFIEIVGFIFNILAIFLLYFASIPKPWSIQTFNGQTPKEKSYENKRRIQRILGTIFLIIGITCMFSFTNKFIVKLLATFVK